MVTCKESDELVGLQYRGRTLVLPPEVASSKRSVLLEVDLGGRMYIAGVSGEIERKRIGSLRQASEIVAAHALAISAVSLIEELASWLIDPALRTEAPDWRDQEWQSFAVLSRALEVTQRAILGANMEPFRAVCAQPRLERDGIWQCSAHHAAVSDLQEVCYRLRWAMSEAALRDDGCAGKLYHSTSGQTVTEPWPSAQRRLEREGRGASRLRATLAHPQIESWRHLHSPGPRFRMISIENMRVGLCEEIARMPSPVPVTVTLGEERAADPVLAPREKQLFNVYKSNPGVWLSRQEAVREITTNGQPIRRLDKKEFRQDSDRLLSLHKQRLLAKQGGRGGTKYKYPYE